MKDFSLYEKLCDFKFFNTTFLDNWTLSEAIYDQLFSIFSVGRWLCIGCMDCMALLLYALWKIFSMPGKHKYCLKLMEQLEREILL